MTTRERTLGARLQEARTNIEMSQETAAAAIGIQPITLSQYELDAQDPSIHTLLSLARVYGVSTDWLLTGRKDIILANFDAEETAPRLAVSHPALALLVNSEFISQDTVDDIAEYIDFILERERIRAKAMGPKGTPWPW